MEDYAFEEGTKDFGEEELRERLLTFSSESVVMWFKHKLVVYLCGHVQFISITTDLLN